MRATQTVRSAQIAIVGAGPRGLSVLERLCAALSTGEQRLDVTVHVVDPHPPGAGAVWRTDQSPQLLMNTVASQVTVFTDDSVELAGPVLPGPSLHEWARFLTLMGPVDESFADCSAEVLAEAKGLGPDDYPTRALYGRYLRWAFERVCGTAPAGVTVRTHASRAVALDDAGERQTLRLADGTVLPGLAAVVLAQGHTAGLPGSAERELTAFARAHGLVHLTPANPADLDLSVIAPGETVLLRGLGLNFFDHLALLTQGRGGRFEDVDGKLVYRPSGREPHLVAGSRRGVPYHSRGANEKGAHGRYHPRLLTVEHVAMLRERGEAGEPVDFRAEIWPLVAREVEGVYYAALLSQAGRGAEAGELAERYLAAEGEAELAAVLDAFAVPQGARWDWQWLARPYQGVDFTGPADYRAWLLDHLRRDLVSASQGNVSGPVKAALDVLRDLRNEIRLAVDHAGLHGASYRADLTGWYTPLNAFLSIGPPASRIGEMIALIEAGVLDVLGPGLRITADEESGRFLAASATVAGAPVPARVLIEARLPEPDLGRTADPLLAHLLATGQVTRYLIPELDGGPGYRTGAVAVTPRPYHVIDAQGRAHPRRFAYGVPTEAVHWATAAGIRPGVNSVILNDSDAIAGALSVLLRAGAEAEAQAQAEAQAATDAEAAGVGAVAGELAEVRG
ncbi:FAD/NAD(P)-binding protein [Kitasatospora sp. NBC_01287]|uniref:FAD/NAD(P)-binding protein n=1 Tax=Kitasatospora sp. NBC_01287 TaxID=2903573 RepID=UPI002258D734|nr:FAD/NAD(P)-binding protein [Kitasatospora sp. NBC_01287]MCX4745629.1 FAD/NAD(P)-binding protein [Kitasatospora sp. NBC_01287]